MRGDRAPDGYVPAATDPGLSTPLLGLDIDQSLVQHPLMPERVVDGRLPLAVLPVVQGFDERCPEGHSPVDRGGDVGHLEHHLVGPPLLRGPSPGPDLGYDQLRRRPVGKPEL